MHPEIPKLLQLQERDQRIHLLQKDLAQLPKMQAAAQAKLSGDLSRVEAAQGHCREIELRIKQLELDAKTRQTTLERLSTQQFETRKNDEFQALGVEIQRYQAEVSQLEDQQLGLMDQLEGARAVLNEAKSKLAVTQAAVDEELSQIQARAEGLNRRLTDVVAERAQLASPIEPATLSLYDRIIKRKTDSAVVPLENGICGGCHMKVVSATIQDAMDSDKLTQCDNCGRLLYYLS
jgi:predicted  nucleic acid-binding Zn-ribbon protein